MHNLSYLYEIQKVLREVNYPDYKRVSKNIIKHIDSDKKLKNFLKELKKGKPWEYICSEADFYTLSFFVNKSVLIPRIETEKIVSLAIREIKSNEFGTIIDVGTGSGCIIISLVNSLKIPKIYSKNLDKKRFIATDISKMALKVAKRNAKTHEVIDKIKFRKDDLIKGIEIQDENVLICANLPYISIKDYKNLDNSVRKYEPKLALDGGDDGNKYYRNLLEQILDKKPKSFTLILETDEKNINITSKIFAKFKTEVIKDIYDKERFLIVKG